MRALTMMCALFAATATARAERTMSDGDAAFAAALHGQLRSQNGNLFYSPVSLRVALAMAMAGARGTTLAELARALSLPGGPEGARIVGAQLADWDKMARANEAPSPDRFTLRVVGRLWAQRGSKILDDFARTMRELYRAPLGIVDFARNGGAARASINDWVANATEQKIPALIASPLARDTKLVLVDAVYFKSPWQTPFESRLTWPQAFFVRPDQTVTAPLMHRLGNERIARVSGALVLERPYAGGRVVMDVILPTAKDGLGAIEDAYVQGALPGWLETLAVAEVNLTLPKLELSSALSLGPALQRLGIVHAMTCGDADFSGMDGEKDFCVGAVVQQAMIEVGEVETEAAAATGITVTAPLMALQPPPPPIVFRADHPFLFLIRDTDAGVVLFAGRVVDPTAH
jgi:serpin B